MNTVAFDYRCIPARFVVRHVNRHGTVCGRKNPNMLTPKVVPYPVGDSLHDLSMLGKLKSAGGIKTAP